MHFVTVLATLAALASATPVVEIDAREVFSGVGDTLEKRANCGSGFSIETYGSNNCGEFTQGISNSGTGCNVCVEMGNAESWKILNPDHCGTLNVIYYHNSGCTGDQASDITYGNLGNSPCVAIPTNIGDHFSARMVCAA